MPTGKVGSDLSFGWQASWAVHGSVHGWCMAWCMGVRDGCGGGGRMHVVGVEKCMCILPGLVGLDLGVGGLIMHTHAPRHAPPMHWPMHSPACPSTKTQIRPHQTCRHSDCYYTSLYFTSVGLKIENSSWGKRSNLFNEIETLKKLRLNKHFNKFRRLQPDDVTASWRHKISK